MVISCRQRLIFSASVLGLGRRRFSDIFFGVSAQGKARFDNYREAFQSKVGVLPSVRHWEGGEGCGGNGGRNGCRLDRDSKLWPRSRVRIREVVNT